MNVRIRRAHRIGVCLGCAVLLAPVHSPPAAWAQEKKIAVEASALPPAIQKALGKSFPGGEILSIEKEVAGEDSGQFDIELRSDGKHYSLEISPDGRVIETKEREADQKPREGAQDKKWTDSFALESCTFVTTGRNSFFVLEPGYRLVLESRKEKVVITVLDTTKKIGDVETRVVEEREWKGGELAEVSRNFFALCKEHGDVYYFGEEVDEYEDGKIVSHSGAWRADGKDSKAGILMPGTVLLGARFYQEISPKAMDRAELLRDDVTLTTPAGTFERCLAVEETSGLDPDDKCHKTYAPGVGLIQDEDLVLSSYGTTE